MAKLIILRGDQHRIFELKDAATSIGRAPDNGLWLDDPSLSRRHCEVRRGGPTGWILKDLGSFNGTFCNNLAVSGELNLKPGDRIQVGSTVLYYVPSEADMGGGAAPAAPEAGSAEEAQQATARRMRNFAALLEITKKVNSELDQQRLLETIIDKAIELIHAERGFLILVEGAERVFKVARRHDKTAIENPERLISKSVVKSVTETGESVLTIDAQKDLSGMSMTIASLEIRSLLCAPLRVKEKILGCIYVDSHVAETEFGEEALNLLQAMADQSAIAMENARLYADVMVSREQEKKVRQMFQKYVPKDVVEKALGMKDGGRLSSKQVATVLFSDIRSFTSISEKMEPEHVVRFLNDYMQRMVEIVFDCGGIVDKFIGDAVMAVFGAPLVKPDDATRAVQCAIRMMEELENFNADQTRKGDVNINIGIGLHTGPLLAGNIGSDRKMEYTVIGDTVNIASRVQDLNKEFKTNIIITQGCYDATGRAFPVRALRPYKVKGKEQEIMIYEVLRQPRSAGPAPAAATTAGSDTGAIGLQTFDIEL
ncbi:MAG TPA: adenylate/guanylate cyclase domain-containing protein [Planctomycetota bacterium]|nr:adenylate/guanylate cyclase domain-containing protein [Planctomycetota bacterium]